MAQQPQGKHMEVKHMDDSDKKRRATILKGVFVVLLLVAVGCGGYVLYMNHLERRATILKGVFVVLLAGRSRLRRLRTLHEPSGAATCRGDERNG